MSGDDGSLFAGHEGRLFAALLLGATAVFVSRFVLSPLVPAIIEDLGVTGGEVGVAMTALWATVGLLRYPAGRLTDALNRKTVLVAGLAFAAAGAALLATTASYLHLLAGSLVLGVGIGLYIPAAVVLVSDLFAARRGRAFGVYEAAVNLGGALAAGFAAVVVGASAWQSAYLPATAGLVGVGVLLHALDRSPYVVRRVRLDATNTVRRVAAEPGLRVLLVTVALLAFVTEATIGFLPTLLEFEKGFGPALAKNAFAVFFVVGIPVNLVAGGLGDRFGLRRVALGGALVAAAGFGFLLLSSTPALVGFGVVCVAAGLTANWPMALAILTEAVPGSSAGGDFGAISTAYVALGSLGPTYVGVVGERVSYVVAFGGLAVLVVGYAALVSRL